MGTKNDLRIEIIVTTMNQKDMSKFKEMNIQTDCVIANQADFTRYDEDIINGHKVRMISTQTRGVGANRNIGLIHSDADIILFADDDMIFIDNYSEMIIENFDKYPNFDGFIFNIQSITPEKKLRQFLNDKIASLKDVSYGGVWGLAIKRDFVLKNNLWFSLLFGGGALYSCGEDTLFLKHLFKNNAKIKIDRRILSNIKLEQSSWFKGINDKYFFDKGVLFYMLNKRLAKFLTVYHVLKHRKKYNAYGTRKAIKIMFEGVSMIKKTSMRVEK